MPKEEILSAVVKGDLERIRRLIDSDPEIVNARDEDGVTPLHLAAFVENEQAVELLLAAGASPNAKDKKGRTPLHCAASRENMAIVEGLLKHSADPNAKDADGDDPMSFALAFAIPKMTLYIFSGIRERGLKPTNIMQLLEYYGWGKKPWWKFW